MSGPQQVDRWVVASALGFLGFFLAVDVLVENVELGAGYAIAALLAATLATVRVTIWIAVTAIACVPAAGLWDGTIGTLQWVSQFSIDVVLGGSAILVARIRTQREQDLQAMTTIAETAQRALIRELPSAVGSVRLGARYVSATKGASAGGDLYEVFETSYGVRAIVGDVRGKGLDAVQLAATVLAAFRRSALTQRLLGEVAVELDRVVSAVAGDEDFVTAVLAEIHPDDTVSLVNCGHHPPVLASDAGLQPLPTGDPQPPLGLSPDPRVVTSPWPRRTRLLLFTDGLVETRNPSGEFFPLAEHGALLNGGTLDEALDRLLASLRRYARGGLSDDIALLLAESGAPQAKTGRPTGQAPKRAPATRAKAPPGRADPHALPHQAAP